MEQTPTRAPEAGTTLACVPPALDEAYDLPDSLRMARLVELVRLLTGCPESAALHAVHRSTRRVPESSDDALDVVARAMVNVSRGVDLREQIDLD